MNVSIYVLCDPGGAIRYVGRASFVPARFQQHLSERGSSPKCRWIAELLRAGVRPTVRVLEEVPALEGPRVELRWIRRLHRRGFALVNVQGCGQPRRRTPVGVVVTPRGASRAPAELLRLARAYYGLVGANNVR